MSTLWLTINLIVFVAWLFCMASWVRGGAKIPRWVHRMAIVFGVLGLVAIGVAYSLQAFSTSLALSCLLLPPAFAYGGWLWLFGPDIQSKNESDFSTGELTAK